MKATVLIQLMLCAVVCTTRVQTTGQPNVATPRMTIDTQALGEVVADDDQAGMNSSIQDNELIFPIPDFQVNLNPDKIKQNPGY